MHAILNRRRSALGIAAVMFSLVAFACVARADIFQWEYINAADPSQGKRQSTTLAPDGAGVDAAPGANLAGRNLTMAYLVGVDVQNASFYRAKLTDADFTGAEIRGTRFRPRPSSCPLFCFLPGTGISAGQLYSTASYQAQDLSGIDVGFHDLIGGDFVGQNFSGANFERANLAGANLRQANFADAFLERATFTGAILSQAKLMNVELSGAELTGAVLTGAELTGAHIHGGALTLDGPSYRGANLSSTTANGFTAAQLYSTVSYQDRNLSSIRLSSNDLTGWNFAGQNLVSADFGAATLRGADLSQTYLSSAYFFGADLTGADLSGARIHGWTYEFSSYQHIPGAYFTSATSDGFTADQLYSTSSYQAHDLTRIGLSYNDLSGWNFADQNLSYANFEGATLAGADLSRANLTNAIFTNAALPGADFNAADARGASLDASDAITTNLIRPDGNIHGLDLNTGGLLVVREYRLQRDRSRKIPIMVDEHVIMGAGGTLRMVFEADAWDSTISFAPSIPVALGGTLELTFADDVDLATQVGRAFKLFDWTGVSPIGAFSVVSPYDWDLKNLYITGEATLTSVPEPRTLMPFSLCLGIVLTKRRVVPRRQSRVLPIAAAMFSVVAFTGVARADIFQWEYINPVDPSLGKRQSTTLVPDGAGVDAVPGADLSGRNLSMANLVGADLASVNGYSAILTFADLTNADLTEAELANASVSFATLTDARLTHASLANTDFSGATLTGVDFTGADVRGASLGKAVFPSPGGINCLCPGSPSGTGITLTQLYSTSSFQDGDLGGTSFSYNNLAGGNFTGQNLTNAYFYQASLTGANFREANLTNAYLGEAILADADFKDAEIRGARFARVRIAGGFCPLLGCFSETGITLPQLYSTASYQSKDLSGISFDGINLAGGNFTGQNLTNANLYSATLIGANLTAADVRGPQIAGYIGANLDGAITTNLISRNGHIHGVDLVDGGLLVVRDYDGDFRYSVPYPPIPITVDEHVAMSSGGTLRMVFEADAWDSTISFAPGMTVTLGGTLELAFADDVNLASQVGRTFDLFDWTGVNPTGAFTISSPYAWDLSQLYTTGEVTFISIPEPASVAVAAAGVFGLTLYRRRKKP